MVCTAVVSKIQACIILMLALVLTSYYGLASGYSATRGKIGVDYGLNGDNLLPPEQAVKLIRSNRIKRVMIYEARRDVIGAFANSGIDLTISVPNVDVPKVAASLGEACNWVTKYVVSFPTSGISAIIVGNEWLSISSNDPSLLVPAMRNIYKALSLSYLSSRIKVSTSHSFNVLSNPSFPPSRATFTEGVVVVMRPLLDFLVDTESFFMIEIFPFYTYLIDRGVGKEFALFQPTEPVVDNYTGLNYTNLFDAQLDAVYAAIASLLSSSPSPPASPSSPSSPCACNVEKASNEFLNSKSSGTPFNTRGHSGWSSGAGAYATPSGGYHPPHGKVFYKSALSLTQTLSSSLNTHAHHNHLNHNASLQNTTRARNAILPPSSSLVAHDLYTHTMPPNSTHGYATLASSSKVESSVMSSSSTPSFSTISTASSLTSSATLTSLAHASNSSNINEHSSRLSTLSSASISHIQRQYFLSRAQYATNAQEVMMEQCTCTDADVRNVEKVATVENARTYNQNLIQHVLKAKGTPAHPNTPIEAYIFELFDEDLNPPGPQQHFGLFFPNGTAVYPINFNGLPYQL